MRLDHLLSKELLVVSRVFGSFLSRYLILRSLGGIAQLVERLLCKQEVSGSTPLISTSSPSLVVGL